MVLCWIALPVFLVLGIFSAKYRRLAWESLECMFRTVTFRKCRSGLDERLKSDVTGKLMRISPRLARGFYNYYKLIAWIFLILLVLSAWFTAVGVYNYYKYGNCNGEDGGFCVINEVVDSDLNKIVEKTGVSEESLAECLKQNEHLGDECLNHCLGLDR